MISQNTVNPVAVVGVAVQLPSNDFSNENLDYHSFWEFLLKNGDARGSVPPERLEGLVSGFSVEGAFLKDIAKFDNVEFGIGSKDAKSMIMSTRRLVELSFLAMLDSGIDYRGKKIGSFMSGTSNEYFGQDTTRDRTIATSANTIANRVSFILNITGPSLYVDTACSSSLTAMHLALTAIQNGECEGALVGGCQYNTNLFDWGYYTEGGILSPDVKSKPFDANANGLMKGEGAVVVVLKSLKAALADHDHVYSVILGSSINSNGGRVSLHAPSAVAQQECIREAFAKAGRNPAEVDFVELHATSTSVGDPVEANAAGEIFCRNDDVLIGSVKGNLGHLESTAFLASLAKVCLILENKTIPPNLNFNTPNPKILWDKYRLRVPTEVIPLGCRSSTGRSLISLASSGIGGSNGHVVVEGPPVSSTDQTLLPDTPVLFVIGGLSPRSAEALSESVVTMLTTDSSLEALSQAVTFARRARQLPWRTHFTFSTRSRSLPKIPKPVLIPEASPQIVMVFTGQGPQHINMGRRLFRAYQVFRDSILEMDRIYEQVVGVSLIQSTGLFDGEKPTLTGVWSVEFIFPALTMVQIALFDLLRSVGVKPDVLMGHSAGETVLVYASGAGSKAMALEISIARARAMKLTESIGGGMAALGCDLVSTSRIIERVRQESPGILEIACHNSLDSFTISGDGALVDNAVILAQKEGIFARKIQTLVPSHSSIMEICKQEYFRNMESVFLRYRQPCRPAITTFSTVAGQEKLITEFTADYFWENLRSPVHFQQAVSTVLDEYPEAAFIEISPHPALLPYISAAGQRDVVCPMRREKSSLASDAELMAFTQALGDIITLGINSIDLTSLYGRASRNKVYDIPYPFTARHFPMRIDGPRALESSPSQLSALRVKMNSKTHPDLAQHVINGEPIVPATAFVDMVLQTGARVLWDVEFNAILSLASELPTEVQVQREQSEWSLVTFQGPNTKIHSRGSWSAGSLSPPAPVDLAAIRRGLTPIESAGFYTALLPLAEFGPVFRRIVSLAGGYKEVLAEIDGCIVTEGTAYAFHPVILDACLHSALHPDIVQSTDKDTIFLPSKLERFIYYDRPAYDGRIYSHLKLVDWTPESRVYTIRVYDEFGRPLCTMHRLELRQTSVSPPIVVEKRYDLVLQPVLMSVPIVALDEPLEIHDGQDETNLHNYLDLLAQNVISQSLASHPAIGTEVHRKRYLSFAEAAVRKILPPAPSPAMIEHLRSKSPEGFEITERLSRVHSQIFESPIPAVEALFSDDLMTRFYETFCSRLVAYTARAFDEIISQFSRNGKRALRILEAGAGTGMLTRSLTGVLEQKVDLVAEYFATDISFALASPAASSCSYPHVIPKTFDLSKPVEDQGFTPGSFDVVTAFHVLHATPVLSATLASLRSLLVPGGCLLVIELDGNSWDEKPGTLWHNFVFGCFAEWYGFTDGRERCMLAPGKWESALDAAGFINIRSAVDKNDIIGFTFAAQKSYDRAARDIILQRPESSFFTYKYGEEARLRDHITDLDVSQTLTLWLLASEGPDGDAVTGLSPTLGQEFHFWKIRVAVFPSNICDESNRIQMVMRHWDYVTEDDIVYFTMNGDPLVSKVVPALPPVLSPALDPAGTWTTDGTTIVQSQLVPLKEGQVVIEILAWSKEHSSLRGFVGSVADTRTDRFGSGSWVVGVGMDIDVSNRIVCDAAHLAEIPEAQVDASLAEDIVAVLIGALALGVPRLVDITRNTPSLRILIPDSTESDQALAGFFKLPALNARLTQGFPSEEDHFDIIILDSSTASTHPELESWLVRRTGKMLIWDTFVHREGERDPWSIGYALSAGLKVYNLCARQNAEVIRPSNLIKTLPASTPKLPLFNSQKAYIILGGASDLGVYMSLWMYKNGAKYIILTSRRGLAFFDEFALVSTKQRFAYLQSRSDLRIRVEGFDATSPGHMSALARSIDIPVGGCFIATLVLHDGIFMRQTPELFHRVSDLKLKAFEAFSASFSITDLDFLVSLSSMMVVLGNSGQSNYAAGNAIMDGKLSMFSNTFSIMLPGISGLGYLSRVQGDARSRLDEWSMSPEEICASIGDGLLKLAAGDRCSRYIPNFAWGIAERDYGLSSSCRHLIPQNRADSSGQTSKLDQTKADDRNHILNTILNLLDVDIADFSAELPMTSYGLDSLGATRISQALRPYASVSQMQLLGGITWQQLEERMNDKGLAPTPVIQSSLDKMMEMVTKYSKNFGVHKGSAPIPVADVVLITGTTGAIGSSVLAELAGSPGVTRIFALNRKAKRPLIDRQREALRSHGLDPTLIYSSKVVLVEGDVTQSDLGVPEILSREIRSSTTHVIHIGWHVDFNLSLSSFEDQVKGVRHLIDFSLSSPLATPPRLLFLSSPAILRQYSDSEPFPETSVRAELAVGIGYGEAKWVSERILAIAASETTLRPIIVRPGQVSGGINGCWKPSEWIPSIIQSAGLLGCLPSLEQEISLIPLDLAAAAIAELRDSTAEIIHVTHTHPIQWNTIFGHVAVTLNVPLVPYPKWLARLEESESTCPVEENPALRLLDYYRLAKVDDTLLEATGLPRFATEVARRESSVIGNPNLRRVDLDDVQRWLEYWRSLGLVHF